MQTLRVIIIAAILITLGVIVLSKNPPKQSAPTAPQPKLFGGGIAVSNVLNKVEAVTNTDTDTVMAELKAVTKRLTEDKGAERWKRFIEIWECDDGKFEVRSDQHVFDRYPTLSHAQTAKAMLAEWIEVEYQRGKTNTSVRLPDCGKRVE